MRKLTLLALSLLLSLPAQAQQTPAKTPAKKTTDPKSRSQDKLDLQGLEQRIQSVLGKIRSATVSVGGGGSGVVISKDGVILTCAHVGRSAGRTISIVFPDGKRVRAKTLGNYSTADAGLVKITDKGDYPFVEMGKSESLNNGDWCLAVGYPVSFPRGKMPPVRIGRVIRASRTSVVSDCPIMGGDSGGPLFDLDGKVIGINSRVAGSIFSNIHVPVDVYDRYWDRLMAGEDWPKRSSRSNRQRPPGNGGPRMPDAGPLGVSGTGMVLKAQDGKVVISKLAPGSTAENLGLRTGDTLVRIGRTEVKDVAGVTTELRKRAGKTVNITVRRARAKSLITYTLPLGK